MGTGLKHPFIVAWVAEDGKRKSSSFASERKRDSMALALHDRGLTVWVADQMQLFDEEYQPVSRTYDPRYEIPF